MMRKYRSLGEVEEEYFVKHPEEVDDYITIIFEEFAKYGNAWGLLSSLHRVARAKGIFHYEVQKTLSPTFKSVVIILRHLGYRLVPEKIR